MSKDTETFNILIVLVIFILIAAVVGYVVWLNRAQFGFSPEGFKINSFVPPKAREAYITAREQLDISKPADIDTLKKLLFQRALSNIPIIINLQKEGNSVEALYRKGMITEHMYEHLGQQKAYMDQEIVQVKNEASSLHNGEETHIWPAAMQQYQLMMAKHKEQAELMQVKQKEQADVMQVVQKNQAEFHGKSEDEIKKIQAERRKEKALKIKQETEAIMGKTKEPSQVNTPTSPIVESKQSDPVVNFQEKSEEEIKKIQAEKRKDKALKIKQETEAMMGKAATIQSPKESQETPEQRSERLQRELIEV